MIDEKALAVELYLLPERKRKRLLSSIPDKFRERLTGYFGRFDLAGGEGPAAVLPNVKNSYSRTACLVELLPGASAGFIDRFGRLLDGGEDMFPPSMANALKDYGAAIGESSEH